MFHPAMKYAAAELLIKSKTNPALNGARVRVVKSIVLKTAFIVAKRSSLSLKIP